MIGGVDSASVLQSRWSFMETANEQQMVSQKSDPPHTIRERAEIVRSDVEASNTSAEKVALGPRRLRRYSNPSADTNYPLEYAFHLAGDIAGRTVLDLGCGSGVTAVLLASKGARVIGVDISTSLLEIGRTRAAASGIASPAFLVGSAHDLPIASESIELVFGIAILHHLDLDSVSREVHRVLRQGGRAIFQEPVRNSKWLQRLRNLVPYQAPDVSPFERPLTDAELQNFARRFVVRRQRPFSLPHINLWSVLPVLKDHAHKMHVIDGALLRRFSQLERLAGIRVVEIEKA
jgi:SAM-dependent methyltransferase